MEVCFGWASELWWRPRFNLLRRNGVYVNVQAFGLYVTFATGGFSK